MIPRFILLSISLHALISPSLFSWNDAGHMIVAEIAYQQLNPSAKEKSDSFNLVINEILPEFNHLHSAATYPDKAKDEMHFAWHYTNIPFDPDGTLSQEEKNQIAHANEGADVVFGIKETIKYLSPASTSDSYHKWLMYAYLIHFVADIHQPLHSATRYSPELPEGDMGGNLFLITGYKQLNLHAFWDHGLDCLPSLEFPLTLESHQLIEEKASELILKYPPDFFSNLDKTTPNDWAEESAQYAHTFAFLAEATPTLEYVEKGREITKERLTLAGYRLARILNELFSN